MNNTEYEYSFKVESLNPYIEFCEVNGYDKVEETAQVRTLYKKHDKTMARVTIKEKNGVITKLLDFKEDILNNEDLTESKESLPIKIEDDKAVDSILDFLEYKKDTVLERTRVVYKKGEVIFELDDYKSPEIMHVVAVEGDKELVDKVYEEISKLKN